MSGSYQMFFCIYFDWNLFVEKKIQKVRVKANITLMSAEQLTLIRGKYW